MQSVVRCGLRGGRQMRGSRNQFEPLRPYCGQERAENTAPSVLRTGSAGPLQRYYETTSGARPGNFTPGLSFEPVPVSHKYGAAQATRGHLLQIVLV